MTPPLLFFGDETKEDRVRGDVTNDDNGVTSGYEKAGAGWRQAAAGLHGTTRLVLGMRIQSCAFSGLLPAEEYQ